MKAQSGTAVTCSRDEASKKMGEKMLQGWTMLGTSCPVNNCCTPLMRNKQGKMFCARCNQFVITEEESIKQALQNAADKAAAKKEDISEACNENERRRLIEQQFRLEAHARQVQEMPGEDQIKIQQAHGAVKRKIGTTINYDSDAEMTTIRYLTLTTLYQKMGSLTNSLSSNDHSERLVSVARAVREIAEAVRILKES
ncbi:hypothetical protein CCR75_005578 [Bremia lactucae]|uniref:Sjoegren syndrome/scleroderma autoantigen 1 n=1 Tax=Bremia lactucae TaxID=4779 RepID=A0A976FFD6_BRELC|nr:hypothetical protein CCR75_005578 [Bremia lactucae]